MPKEQSDREPLRGIYKGFSFRSSLSSFAPLRHFASIFLTQSSCSLLLLTTLDAA